MRAQASFELVIVIALMLLLTGAIALDFFTESTNTIVLSAVKQTALQKAAEKALDPSCASTYLESVTLSTSGIKVVTKGCSIPLRDIANAVETAECHAVPNGDTVINCGGTNYALS